MIVLKRIKGQSVKNNYLSNVTANIRETHPLMKAHYFASNRTLNLSFTL
jgi:hypothetical protein